MAIRDMTPTHAAFVTVSDGSTSRSTAKADFMSSDPYLSIQAAVDFIEANSIDGGIVWVRAGTYTFTTNNPITITNDNIHIIGEGWETIIKKDLVGTNVHNSVMFDINAGKGSIQNLEIDYNTNTRGNVAIDLQGVATASEGFLIRNVRFVGNNANNQHYLQGGNGVKVEDCHVESDCVALSVYFWYNSGTECELINVFFEGTGLGSLSFAIYTNGGSYGRIIGTHSYGSLGGLVTYTSGVYEALIADNHLRNMNNDFIKISGGYSSNITITGNKTESTSSDYLLHIVNNSALGNATNNVVMNGNNGNQCGLFKLDLGQTDNNTYTLDNFLITNNSVDDNSGIPLILLDATLGDSQSNIYIENFKFSGNNLKQSSNGEFFKAEFTGTATSGARPIYIKNLDISNNNMLNTATNMALNGIYFNFADTGDAGNNVDYYINGLNILNNNIILEDADSLDAIYIYINNGANVNSFSWQNICINDNSIINAGDGGIDISIGANKEVSSTNVEISRNVIDCNAGHGILWTAAQENNVNNNFAINDNIIKPQLAESVEYGIQFYDGCERIEICRNEYEGQFVGVWVSAYDSSGTETDIYDCKINDNIIECLANTLANPAIMVESSASSNFARLQIDSNQIYMTTAGTDALYQKGIQFGEYSGAGDFYDVQCNGNKINIVDTGTHSTTHKPIYIAADLVRYQINNNQIYLSTTDNTQSCYAISLENPDNATIGGTIVGNLITLAMAAGGATTEVGVYIGGAATALKCAILSNNINLDDSNARYGIQWAAAHTGFSSFPNYIYGATQQYWYNGTNGPPAAGADFAGCWWFEDGAAAERDRLHMCMESAAGAWSWVELANGGA